MNRSESPEKTAEHDSARPIKADATSRKPEWLKVRAPGGDRYVEIKEQLRALKLHTVCEEARCPNVGECWSGGTATIMLLGDVCTRGCRFCAIKTGKPGGAVDGDEPAKVGGLVARSGLDYVVLTSVNRDDLADGGARHFADTIRAIKQRAPRILVEALVPDFQGDVGSVEEVIRGGVDVYAHNIETVRSLTSRVRDRRATYDQSLATLRHAKLAAERMLAAGELSHPVFVKTSLQVGHGETAAEVEQTLRDLRANQVDVVTFGQYLQPTKKHLKVVEFISPVQFRVWEELARRLGFRYAASGPLVRSSYRAGEFFMSNMIHKERETDGL